MESTIKKLKEQEKKKEIEKKEKENNQKGEKSTNIEKKIKEEDQEKKDKDNNNKIKIEEKEKEENKDDIDIDINNENIINNDENNNNIELKNEEELPENIKTFFGGIFGSQTEKSFAKVRIKSQDSICAFTKNNILVIISSDNKYYQALIDIKKGGDCKIIFEDYLIKQSNK